MTMMRQRIDRGSRMNFTRCLLASGCALGALAVSTSAFAQSSGTIANEEPTIIVTGVRNANGVHGVVVPDTPKARSVLTAEIIQRQSPGQSILNTINLVPGVNFTQSDPYGSAGGNIRIRGFDGAHIALTWDGFPLNDSGNYAVYSNQQLDPEVIEQVNVNLGATDVDSPTAASSGGTVNYRTRLPYQDFGALMSASMGDDSFFRIFGSVDTGEFTPWGTRAFFSASTSSNDKFKGVGKNVKYQYNARIYQPLGNNGDFISLAGHFNQNRNNFYRNPSLTDLRTRYGAATSLGGQTVPAAGNITANTPFNLGALTDAQEKDLFFFENDRTCTRVPGGPGAQLDNLCSNFYGVRINPSNTGNVRFNSRFTLTDQLIFTFDAAYSYTLANGGGYTSLAENSVMAKGANTTGPGVDFNRDGDYLDTIGFYTPNTTNTNRITAIASLVWKINDQHRLRIAYTYDHARHRQTGEWGPLQDGSGFPISVFGGRTQQGVYDSAGFQLGQRDRRSIALLNQISGEYTGKFFDDNLTINVGIRAPFFHRDLQQYCFTQTGGSGFATCTSAPNGGGTIVPPTVVNPGSNTFFAPFNAIYNYRKVLPSASFSYRFTPQISLFGSFTQSLSAPRTDNLYRAPIVNVQPEETKSFDLGMKYSSRTIQAMATAWYVTYKNRIVTSFDQDQGISVDRNVGKVEGYGVDANIAWQIIPQFSVLAFGSYNHSELKDNIQLSGTNFALTAGKRVTETPEWSFGGRAQVDIGPVSAGAQYKWVDQRFATDLNDVIVPSYGLLDLDARISLEQWGARKTYLQFNVLNVFDKFYFGNISTQISSASAAPSFALGSPRTWTGSVVVGF